MKFPKKLHYIKPPPDETWFFLERLNWFSRVGKKSDISYGDALKMATSNEWKDFTLERRNGFEAGVVQSIQWNVIAYMMEETYSSWGVPRLFDRIIGSPKKGKLPCGWFGDYPNGNLIEY